MIDPKLKRALGQMIKGVQVVATTHDGATRAYTSHWVGQVAFEEPIVMASVSPKHDTHPLIVASGWFTVSILAGDQLDQGQYFSYPGRKFHYIADDWLTTTDDGWPIVADCIAWLRCEVFERKEMFDHDLFFARVTEYGYGRLKEPPLAYSSRHGWRIAGERARKPGESPRDRLLARLADAGYDPSAASVDDDED
ncbi:MAG TPA: flavin reductase family protein [Acidimicrobiia bacterium]|nr:flavin reductase family protein [Acidimicrobiia bacterium]